MSYLVDTDILIDALHGVARITTWIDEHADDGLSVSIVSVGEIYEGAYRSTDAGRHLAAMRNFLLPFTNLNLTDAVMEIFARERAQLREQGRLIPDLDLLIAATALAHGLALVTRNTRHFQRIPNLRLSDGSAES